MCTAGRHGDIFHLAAEKHQAFSYRALLFVFFVMSADDARPKEGHRALHRERRRDIAKR